MDDHVEVTRRRHRRLPVLAPLTLLFLLLVVVVPAPMSVVGVSDTRPWCFRDPWVPEEAHQVEEFARTHTFSPPPRLKGNSTYRDDAGDLPAQLAPFKEYDVFPKPPGRPRRPERVVLSPSHPYASWYSPDHYATFRLMFSPACLVLPVTFRS